MLTRFRRRINAGGAAGALAALAAGAVFAAVALLCLSRATDSDLYWHLETGRLIRATGEVPGADPFSYTAYRLPWIDIQWLFQVGASLLHDAGGLPALTLAAAILITGLFALLWRRCRRALAGIGSAAGAATAAAAIVLLAALASQERFLTRPEVLSWWLLAATLAGLDAALRSETAARRRVILWIALPAAVLAWVNMQSLFILGPAMTALALIAALAGALLPGAARRPGPAAPAAQATDLLASLALQASAALLNPHGARAVRLPFEQFFDHLGGGTLLATTIAEFRPTLSGDLTTPALVAFFVLAAATAAALGANLRRSSLLDILVAGATLFLALRARRNIPIFAVAAAPILARHAGEAVARLRERRAAARAAAGRPAPAAARAATPAAAAAVALLALALAAGVVTNRFYLLIPTERWFGLGAIPHYFPDESARFVHGASLPGQVFHPLAAGGFLIGAWSGERRVFIDGRNDPYLHGVLETYLRAVADPERFEATARKYQITAVLWPHQRALEGKALLQWLAGGRGWVLVHLDPGAAIYAREDVVTPGSPAAAGWPGRRPPAEIHARLREGLAARPFAGPPIREIALADFLGIVGDAAGAESFLRPAIAALPRSAVLRHKLGLALEALGRRAEARAAFARAVALEPGLAAAQGALGALALEDGDAAEAERRLDRAWRDGDRSPRTLAARARLLESQGRARDAEVAWEEAVRAAPGSAAVLIEAARFHVRRDQEPIARSLYELCLRRHTGEPTAALERAALLERAGMMDEALVGIGVAADLAAARLAGEPSGAPPPWAAPAPNPARSETDRRLLAEAARLARRAGEGARAAAWEAALRAAGAPPQR